MIAARAWAVPLLAATALAAGSARAAPVESPPDVQARGEQVMRSFCLSCHGSPGGKVEDPLGPRLRPEVWGDPERAYAAIGQLAAVNRRMDQPFTGSDADRRALADWLARRARENEAPAWKVAAPWAAGAAGVLLAALFLRSRRRG
jgi:mono/diheme cytochrome c family protein